MATYSIMSPWHNTETVNELYLGLLSIRPVPETSDDVLYTVEVQYTHRPDLLAYDLYGSTKLWWVFSQRNPEALKDPIYDLVADLKIYLPQGPKLRSLLGL
jgi:hypothetical protein